MCVTFKCTTQCIKFPQRMRSTRQRALQRCVVSLGVRNILNCASKLSVPDFRGLFGSTWIFIVKPAQIYPAQLFENLKNRRDSRRVIFKLPAFSPVFQFRDPDRIKKVPGRSRWNPNRIASDESSERLCKHTPTHLTPHTKHSTTCGIQSDPMKCMNFIQRSCIYRAWV